MKLIFTFFLSSITFLSYAQIGIIDKTYGSDNTGTVLVSKETLMSASAIQPDDRLLVGGTDYMGTKFSLMRLLKEGAIDTDFGENGQVTTAIDDIIVKDIDRIIGWQSIAVQADGSIVAVGTVTKVDYDTEDDFPRSNDIVVARYLADGTPDPGFGNAGKLVTDLGKQETASAIAVQADGKVLVAGYQADAFDGFGSRILLIRYNADGSLDASFGEGKGYVRYDNKYSRGFSLLIQPDGKIVVGGSANVDEYFFLVRYLPDGTVDASFGDAGQALTIIGNDPGVRINSIAIDENGRIAATGVAGQQMAVARYLPNGQLDNSFDADGKVLLSFEGATDGVANTVLVQPEGKLVISGAIAGGTYSVWTAVLTGLNADGSLDASFGNGGRTITNLGFQESTSTDAVMQKDGKIIIAGNYWSDDFNNTGYSATRFNGYPTKVPLFVRIKRWLQNHGISWKGLPQDNIAYYSVEQSANGKSGFTPIAKVSGSSNLKEYSITNSHILQGTNYYRVKAVSTDGAIKYSEVVSANNTSSTASVFPNPVKDYVMVKGLPSDTKAQISITDGSGNVLAKGGSNGNSQYRCQTSNINPGTYYLNVTTLKGTETLKFVKQ